jgi:type IV pilus assembly protein PilA
LARALQLIIAFLTKQENFMKRSIQKGFTLIELMIVVAIIGILAAIALPQYQTYIAKSQFSRVMGETGNVKTAVEQCVINGNATAILSNVTTGTALAVGDCNLEATASTLMVGTAQGTKGAAAVTGVNGYALAAVSDTGIWTITGKFGNGATSILTATDKDTITWTRSTEGTWSCTTKVDSKYRAKGCEQTTA